MTSTPQVDMEELKRQLKRELPGDVKPILEAQGIQFSDIARVMSEEECRSNLASTIGGGRPQGELQVLAFGPVKGHEQPLPSFKSNTIDNLAQPTTCNLVVIIEGSFRMEVRKGLVYPHQTLHDNIQINASTYAVVKVDMVHENTKNMKLKVPPDDTTLTLRDAITKGFSGEGLLLMLTHLQ
jgi:hypothetical protein